ncbi:MAG: C10 family peptidase [Sedimentisphaerales bacterium]|nr:C10 family peptidase [Sedimentisphaerales bacterium]
MRYRGIILTAIFAAFQLYSNVSASPITADEAKKAVTGWLITNPQPFDTVSERQILEADTFSDETGKPVYHIVYLEPSGFVIVSANDLIEPIIGFADSGAYDPSDGGPLWALVTQDLNGRTLNARDDAGSTASLEQLESNQARQKWKYFIDLASESGKSLSLESAPAICDDDISDIRVSPLIKSKWGQTWYYGLNYRKISCFNYYTPQLIDDEVVFIDDQIGNYPAGCLAVAIAQLMRYHKYPDYAIALGEFNIFVGWQTFKRGLILGSGPGGEYNWDDMVYVPVGSTTGQQRRAIGSICHDVGIAINTQYTEEGSGAYMRDALIATVETFGYPQAIWAANEGENIDSQYLLDILNPNLDANSPVILGIMESPESDKGHAVVCDGYGYNNSTMYHHLNIGWYGIDDCWYNLPNIDAPSAGTYSIITECLYNVFPDCTGEIISGRITNGAGKPIKDVSVTARKKSDRQTFTTTTNNNGIYAFKGIPSDSIYTITANKSGYDFERREAQTGISDSREPVPGNKWAVDLTGYDNCVTATIGDGTTEWDHPLYTYFHDSRTQVIYLADEIGAAGAINSLALNIVSVPDETVENWTIRMKHTALIEYNESVLDSDGWTVVYQKNNETMDTGWQTFLFQNVFEYDGSSNLLVDFCHDNSSYTESGLCEATNSGSMRSVYVFSDSMLGDPLEWSTENSPKLNRSVMIPNIQLKIGGESQVIIAESQAINR